MDDSELIDDLPKAPPRWPAVLAVCIGLAVLAAGPWLLGFGWFGARLLASDKVDVHILNTSGEDLTVEVSFAEPLAARAGTMETVESLSGPITITARNAAGETLESLDVTAEDAVFYNALGSECLAVFDLTDLYGGEGQVTVHERVPQEQRLITSTANVLLLPRRTPPDEVAGTVHYIEIVPCSLLEPSEEEFLIARALLRLEQRRDEYDELRRQAR